MQKTKNHFLNIFEERQTRRLYKPAHFFLESILIFNYRVCTYMGYHGILWKSMDF